MGHMDLRPLPFFLLYFLYFSPVCPKFLWECYSMFLDDFELVLVALHCLIIMEWGHQMCTVLVSNVF